MPVISDTKIINVNLRIDDFILYIANNATLSAILLSPLYLEHLCLAIATVFTLEILLMY